MKRLIGWRVLKERWVIHLQLDEVDTVVLEEVKLPLRPLMRDGASSEMEPNIVLFLHHLAHAQYGKLSFHVLERNIEVGSLGCRMDNATALVDELLAASSSG